MQTTMQPISPTPPPVPIEVLTDPERVASAMSPLRLEMLGALRQPDSAAGLARRMGQPRQRLNHHLRELERAGFLRLVGERVKGNCVERLYRTTAESYLIAPAAMGPMAPERAPDGDRFSWARLVTLLGGALGDLARLRRGADRAGEHLVTASLDTEIRFATPARLAEFNQRLAEAVARLAAEYHDDTAEAGRGYRLVAGTYPATPPVERGTSEPDRRQR
jgi:DNA-binding transcriptional ArsR family regulator